ncbi:MAG TPA: UDP-N-acetylmuramoyl-L-alanyl-D-glutamate--2,6-diaminopimelate ligase [Pyrinomonadaceae bacterium]|jgi:UDP-N-acetylmuramoyl-L-alanyl-D-glutamate--2,6-diaminopimelate ligase
MTLEEMLQGINVLEIKGSLDISISSPAFDSRKVEQEGLYVAVPGTQVDGHIFIEGTIEKGAHAIVCEKFPEHIHPNVTYVRVASSSEALGQIAANFYNRPSERMKLVGVTGTNGKTTTVTLLARIFRALGYNVGFLSTIRNQINEDIIPSTHTTPDAIQINELMHGMVEAGCTYCFMEVTSHAIVQNRVGGLVFSGGVFTNLTHDHLDYHKTMEAYFDAKKQFFDGLGSGAFALSNIDDERGHLIIKDTKASKKTYSLNSQSDFKCQVMETNAAGLVLNLDGSVVRAKLKGRFNAYNILAAYAASLLLGGDRSRILEVIPELDPVEGRFDFVPEVKGISGIVDFAHTPDGLEKILASVNEVKAEGGRLITVVGCGGDKDKEKRPEMGKIAYENSDVVILTSDNPRSEDPLAIIQDMQQDFPVVIGDKALIIVDRREAIQKACNMARPGDIVLVAGRGHEKYQFIGNQKIPFEDKVVLEESLMAVR